MPKSTHQHVDIDARNTDRKFRPEDEAIYKDEKQEFQQSEQDKKAESTPEEEFIPEQQETSEGDGKSDEGK